MKYELSGDHPIRHTFAASLRDTLDGRMGIPHSEPLVDYLSEMLVRFLHFDGIYAVRDAHGRPVTSVAEMTVEGDVRLNADSFERERAVHQHIGDFLLFWSGVFPEFLPQIKAPVGKDALLDPIRQGQMSYYVVSTFDHGRYADEAPTFRRLSEEFDLCRASLYSLRNTFDGLRA
ncbi:MAG: hypothetical protein ACO1SV_22435 [Fimbriimonas sp.]